MAALDLLLGDRVRFHRMRQGRSQEVVAGLVGITPDYLSMIERGKKAPSLDVLTVLARELGVPVADLLAEQPSAIAAPPNTSAAQITRALLGFGPARSAPPASPTQLRERVEAAWRAWQSAPNRFSIAADVLPSLIADVEHATRAYRSEPASRREALRIAADLYGLLRSYLRRAGRIDLSLMAADRAARAAEEADDPLRIAAASWNLGHVLMWDGEPEGAEEVATRASAALARELPDDEQALALTGALGLVGVVGAARRRDWWTARERLEGIAQIARSCGDALNPAWTVFGPTNVELHRVSIEMEAGQAADALRLAERIDTGRLPSRERVFTFQLEIARCYDLRRDDPAALLCLLQLEQSSPEDLARSALAKEIVLAVWRRARPLHARQAEHLAQRMGVL